MKKGLFLKNWQLAVISDHLHDGMLLNSELTEEGQEVLDIIDEHILEVKTIWEGENK